VPLPKELLELVACPKCKGEVTLEKDESGFVCPACQLFYAIVDGIPDFLIENARPIREPSKS
jgi:hypothetical protein